MPDLTGRLLAARRESLGLSQLNLARQLHETEGERDDIASLVRWIQRVESGEEYRGRTGPTRARYRRLLEILQFERDEPALEILTSELEHLSARFEALQASITRFMEGDRDGAPAPNRD